jgi:tetratricopeptide (TPR) repeat protein
MRAPAIFAALALAFSFGAAADEASDSRAARAAFQKGQTEYNLGNYAEAAKQFEETYRIKPVPALLFNIAQCYRFIGNLEKAVQTYRSYLRNAPPTDKNLKLAKELLDQVEKALASKQKAEQRAPHGLAQGGQDAAAGSSTTAPGGSTTAPGSSTTAAGSSTTAGGSTTAPGGSTKAPAGSTVASTTAAPAGTTPAPGTAPAGSTAPLTTAATSALPASTSTSSKPPPDAAPAGALPTPGAPSEPAPRFYSWVAAGGSALFLAGGAYFGSKSNKTLSDLKTGFHTQSVIDSQTASAKSDAGKANGMLVLGAALAVTAGVLFVLHF